MSSTLVHNVRKSKARRMQGKKSLVVISIDCVKAFDGKRDGGRVGRDTEGILDMTTGNSGHSFRTFMPCSPHCG